jgi:pimeloyl-ACP methyl ester carboxylesterase
VNDQPISGTPNRNGWIRRVLRIALSLMIVYLFCVGMLAFFQRSLIYLPSRDPQIDTQHSGLPAGQVHTVTLTTKDGLELRGWHILPDGVTAADREQCDQRLASGQPVIIYFSGNAGNRAYRTMEFELFTHLDCHVLVFDYRGYGDNPGSPSEELLAEDAQAIWRYAVETRKLRADRIVLFGESLGGGVAVRLAAELCVSGTPPGGLVLRSSFSSLVDVAAHHYRWLPVRMLMIDRFPSAERISDVSCPILHIHGVRDRIVPIEFGRELFAAAPDSSSAGVAKRFVELPLAGHNDILYVADREFAEAVDEYFMAVFDR